MGLAVAQYTGQLFGIRIAPLDFRYSSLRDSDGLSLGLRATYCDIADLLRQITTRGSLIRLVETGKLDGRVGYRNYLIKSLVAGGHLNRISLIRAVYLIAVVRQAIVGQIQFFMVSRPFFPELETYAVEKGIVIKRLPIFTVREFLKQFLGAEIVGVGRQLRSAVMKTVIRIKARHHSINLNPRTDAGPCIGFTADLPHVFYKPGMTSDLWFLQDSARSSGDVFALFVNSLFPLDKEMWEQCNEHGIRSGAINYGAWVCQDAPLIIAEKRLSKVQDFLPLDMSNWKGLPCRRWLVNTTSEYHIDKTKWLDYFSRLDIRIFLTWHRYGVEHCAIADAQQELGGILAMYQRSCEEVPAIGASAVADVEFAWSPHHAAVAMKSGSSVGYHVAVGYLGDHHFSSVSQDSNKIRDGLCENGAEWIMAYFDENSSDDGRFFTGHSDMRENYLFLLEKVLKEPWFGLVLKPKVLRTLRKRLGDVGRILARAEATGRCIVIGEAHSVPLSYFPPALAAGAADLVVHGELHASTAGVESALAGKPTLLLDREGWSISPLYELGVGRVVFNDWDSLWKACKEASKNLRGVTGLGDWGDYLMRVDPFRDGRAAERMSTYLAWLLAGFKENRDREIIMADAAERYSRQWGADKIASVSGSFL